MSWISVGIAVAGAVTSAYAANQQAKTSQKIANNNAIVAEYQAQDAQQRGEQEAQAARRQAEQLAGAQRAAMSARGLDISDGTAADILDQTNFFGQEDARISRMNAAKEAWALRARKGGFEAEGKAARQQGNGQMIGSLLGGAGKVSSRWSGGGAGYGGY